MHLNTILKIFCIAPITLQAVRSWYATAFKGHNIDLGVKLQAF
mgnify:FL=1